MFGEIQKFDINAEGIVRRPKSEMRIKMESLEVGEGFIFQGEGDIPAEKRKAQAAANNLQPHGKKFSIQWVDNKAGFRVVRTQ